MNTKQTSLWKFLGIGLGIFFLLNALFYLAMPHLFVNVSYSPNVFFSLLIFLLLLPLLMLLTPLLGIAHVPAAIVFFVLLLLFVAESVYMPRRHWMWVLPLQLCVWEATGFYFLRLHW